MAASTIVPLTKTSQAAFVEYYRAVQDTLNPTRDVLRSRFEEIDRAYQREDDNSDEQRKAKAANRLGDKTKFQNITVPVVAPQVETAVTYQTSVFLTGYPIFGVVSSPEYIDAAIQLETILEENSIRGGWARELILFFRDGFKYNFAPIEISWNEEVTQVPQSLLEENIKEAVNKEVIWAGNCVHRLDPYNTFVDTRVPPSEVYKRGEFAGYTQYMSRIELKSFISTLPDKIVANIRPAFESSSPSFSSSSGACSHYTPSINPNIIADDYKSSGTDWLRWASLSTTRKEIAYKDAYEVTTLYCKVLPSEFELRIPNRNLPQIYKLILVNHEHIIYCEQQTNAHGFIPILIGQPLEDGLGYQTKSLADNVTTFQDVTSAYMNSIIHSRRRAITDRVLYDPSRISAAHINSDNPSAKIPVRPAAYGKPIGESVFQFPYREDQAVTSVQQIQQLLSLSNYLSGQNQVSQGQFVKGNKTREEFSEVMANANGRDQLASILLESQVFVPLKEILKLNILQYQGGTTLYNRDKQRLVEIDPIALRKAVLAFSVSDGLLPSSKILSLDTLTVALQVLGSSPQIASGYNIAPLFSYLMKAQGAKIAPFEKSPEQQAYEQALGSWQQLATITIEKGGDLTKLPPQPLPEQYGYKINQPPAGAAVDK